MKKDLAYFELKQEIEEFLYLEADLLDARKFREWLDLLAEDLVYFMPIRRNVKFGQHAEKENTRQGEGISWFDEDKWTLGKRVDQILTGVHYAEEPLSRVTHLVSNIRLLDRMPKVYSHPKVDPSIVPKGHTNYRVFISPPGAKPSALFTDGLQGPHLHRVPDGVSYTIMIVEAAEAVPWTMPEGLLFDPSQPLPKLGGLVPGITQALMVNTAGHSFRSDFPEDKMRAWITKDGGEPVDDE